MTTTRQASAYPYSSKVNISKALKAIFGSIPAVKEGQVRGKARPKIIGQEVLRWNLLRQAEKKLLVAGKWLRKGKSKIRQW